MRDHIVTGHVIFRWSAHICRSYLLNQWLSHSRTWSHTGFPPLRPPKGNSIYHTTRTLKEQRVAKMMAQSVNSMCLCHSYSSMLAHCQSTRRSADTLVHWSPPKTGFHCRCISPCHQFQKYSPLLRHQVGYRD